MFEFETIYRFIISPQHAQLYNHTNVRGSSQQVIEPERVGKMNNRC